jgi:hypothetical protein
MNLSSKAASSCFAGWNIPKHYGIGAYKCMITNLHVAQNFCSRSNIHMSTDPGRRLSCPSNANRYLLEN